MVACHRWQIGGFEDLPRRAEAWPVEPSDAPCSRDQGREYRRFSIIVFVYRDICSQGRENEMQETKERGRGKGKGKGRKRRIELPIPAV
jgi:hypothetical protein